MHEEKPKRKGSHHQFRKHSKKYNLDFDNQTIDFHMGFKQVSSIMDTVPLMIQFKQNRIVQNMIKSIDSKSIDDTPQWKVGKPISHGSTATVYKALNIKNGTIAAVKKIIFNQVDENISKKQLKILCKICHPNIVRYIQHQQVQNQQWIFMQYIPYTLLKFLNDYGIPPYQNYLIFAKQLIIALNYLHNQKIFHKDIKCSNVLLDYNGTLKLSDFGCSKGFDQTLSLVNYQKQGCRTFKGSILWMAPQVIKLNNYSRKTDIWSLGCTFLQMITGKPPWSQKNFDNQMTAVWVIASQQIVPQIPQSINQNIKILIQSCLKRNPQDRLTTQELMKLPFFLS